jgi:soluble cytochrome b562
MTNKSIRDYINLIETAEQGVAEGPGFDKWADDRAASQLHKLKPATTWEVSYDYGPHMSKTVTVKAGSEEEARAKVEKAAEKKGMSIMINSVEPAEQGVAEGQIEEASPEAIAKINNLTRRP